MTITRQDYWASGEKPTETEWNRDLDAIFALFASGFTSSYMKTSGSGAIGVLDIAQTYAARKTFTAGVIVDEIVNIGASGAGLVKSHEVRWDPASGTLADDDGLYVSYMGDNDAGTPEETEYARLAVKFTDVTDDEEDGVVELSTIIAGSLTEVFEFGATNATTRPLNASGGGSLTGTWTDLGTITTVDINGGTIDGTVIGGASAAAGTFTTLGAGATTVTDLSSTGNTTIGNATGDAFTINPSAWTLANAVTITGTWTDLGTVTTADINGGTLDGVTIGGASAAAATVTTLNTSGAVVHNEAGADVDFRIESDDAEYIFFVNGGDDRVNIGASASVAKFYVSGTESSSGNTSAYGSLFGTRFIASSSGTGNRYGAIAQGFLSASNSNNLTQSSSPGLIGLGATVGDEAGASGTVTNAAGVYITDASLPGSAVITNLYGLWIDEPTGGGTKNVGAYIGGNVGIGTASPAKKLHIRDDTGNSQLILDNTGNQSSIYATADLYLQPNLATAMTLKSGGNVGIGTASPRLDTRTFANSNLAVTIYNSTGDGANDAAVLELGSPKNTDNRTIGGVAFVNNNNGDDTAAKGKGVVLLTGVVETSDANAGDDSGGHFDIYTKPEGAALAQIARFSSSGNVGIGTASPGYRTDIRGAAGSVNVLNIGNSNFDNVNTGSTLLIAHGSATGDTHTSIQALKTGVTAVSDIAFQLSGGNVGIGTTPSNLLHMKSESNCYIRYTDTTDGDAAFVGVSQHIFSGSPTVDYLGLAGTSGIEFGYGSTIAMTLDSSGNLGLGVTPESAPYAAFTGFQFGGTGYLANETTAAAGAQVWFGQNVISDTAGNSENIVNDEASLYQQINGSHLFFTAGAQAPGDITWGTAKLTIANDGQSTFYGDKADSIFIVQNDGNSADRSGIRVTAGADDGSGNTYYLFCNDGDGDNVGYIWNTSGTFQLVDASDESLKENITATKIKGIEGIRQIELIEFDRKKSGEHVEVGFGAHQLNEIYPHAVAKPDPTDEDSEPKWGVSKAELVGPLVKSVQDLDGTMQTFMGRDLERSQEIDALKKRIELLEAA